MKEASSLWQWAGFGLTTLLGTLLHFLYGWTGGNLLAAPFSAVNESTWEHMKLLYWPLLLFALAQRRFFRRESRFWCLKPAQILLGVGLIPVLFYCYNGAVGLSTAWVNVAIFYVSAAIAFLFERWALRNDLPGCRRPRFALAVILLLGVLFAVFTFFPLRLPLFEDPHTGSYGIIIGYRRLILSV